MTENPETTPSTEGYDPAADQDADPESLSPRTGAAAIPDAGEDAGDPDADPDMLNPREG
ncbi:hypothetical protein [Actinotalea fermentans]|nr:hypothetical protein [Actinotalea fermentans]